MVDMVGPPRISGLDMVRVLNALYPDDEPFDDCLPVRTEQPEVEVCHWCTKPDPHMETVDGGKRACSACVDRCHFCEDGRLRPFVARVPRAEAGIGIDVDALLVGGEVAICDHHLCTEVLGMSGEDTAAALVDLFPDTEVTF